MKKIENVRWELFAPAHPFGCRCSQCVTRPSPRAAFLLALGLALTLWAIIGVTIYYQFW